MRAAAIRLPSKAASAPGRRLKAPRDHPGNGCEALDLRAFGKLQITRASHVEPDSDGNWLVDMGPSGGPVLGPFGMRGEALTAERGWLRRSAS